MYVYKFIFTFNKVYAKSMWHKILIMLLVRLSLDFMKSLFFQQINWKELDGKMSAIVHLDEKGCRD